MGSGAEVKGLQPLATPWFSLLFVSVVDVLSPAVPRVVRLQARSIRAGGPAYVPVLQRTGVTATTTRATNVGPLPSSEASTGVR